MRNLFRLLWRDQIGMTTVEYAMLLALVSVAAVVAWTTLGQRKGEMLSLVNSRLEQ